MLKKFQKLLSPKKIILLAIFLSSIGLLYGFSSLHNRSSLEIIGPRQYPPAPECHHNRIFSPVNNRDFNKFGNENSQTRQRVLIFLRNGKTQLGQSILQVIETVRFKYHTQQGDVRNLPVLIDDNKGRYSLIIFEDIFTYLNLHQWNREMIDKYCLDYNVGMVYFIRPAKHDNKHAQVFHNVGNFPLEYASGMKMKNYELNASSPLLRIARPGEVWNKCLEGDWIVFKLHHPTYSAVSFAEELTSEEARECKGKKRSKKSRRSRNVFSSYNVMDYTLLERQIKESKKLITVVHDSGQLDGIQRVIFGGSVKFWIHKVLFLDALSYVSRGRLSTPLERYIQIDIDDVFVGIPGNRMNSADLEALISFQEELRKTIPGFTYHLGFSGKFIFSGNQAETEADHMFLKVHHHFQWFPHMWSHMQAHWFNNETELCEYMDINYRFAIRWHLNISSHYAVAPHHAGVFPIHEQLYNCWRHIWNITTTSTEEYPHLRPDHKRRGFMYKGVKVLPRQTCGLFTHTMVLHQYPEGPDALHSLINGGTLFQSFLYNQFNIFMTHLSNYGNDRLGLYTFDRVVKFVSCWTNLQLLYVEPKVMAEKYFSLYPDELDPVWLNPCLDKRHMEIWSSKKDCSHLPDFVVVGPQKTGTTALYWFLNMHPDVESNRPSAETFEELQFFSGKNYYKGIDWYMDYFPISSNQTVTFEKSATYFDQPIVAKRLSALLPKKPIVVILSDPAKRAYSWYQHMKSHDDKIALQYSFSEIIRARRKGSPGQLISLQRRCLDPGFYADHLEKWLEYIPASKIVIVDGEKLKENPVEAMKEIQISLEFKTIFDYDQVLRFDEKKGFFCQLLSTGKTKCLGRSKGRQYPDMDEESRQFLNKYYSEANTKLIRVLRAMNKSIPLWLNEET